MSSQSSTIRSALSRDDQRELFQEPRCHGAWLPQDDFLKHFAPDVDPIEANVMYAVQQPLAASALGDVMGTPAWKSLPTWFAVSQNDEVIPPDAERLFAARMGATVSELVSGHVGMVSHPEEVTTLIKSAAESVS